MTTEPSDAVALLTLDRLPGVGPVTVLALVRAFGSAEAALGARFDDFAAVAGVNAARARGARGLRAEVERLVLRAARAGVEMVSWTAPRYPAALRQLVDPPPVLFLRGRSELLGRPGIAVVGARRSTLRGREFSERLGRALGRAGLPVVSGLALGIDGAAHAGALAAEGDTIAVLGTGPDVVYPRLHARLFRTIGERGLLVSEFLPGTPAAPHHFPRRNRILAALSSTVVVVEAGARSGALITVDHALDLGRDVWTVPGPVDGRACVGSNRLLADGARPLVSVPDFLSSLGSDAPTPEPAPVGAPGQGGKAVPDGGATGAPSTLEERVLAALDDRGLTVDDLTHRLALPVETTLAVLTTLEVHGDVERLSGMRFRRAA